MKIFLDDNRICPAEFTLVRTVEAFEQLVRENRNDLQVISLDYDLSASGSGRTGMNACDFIVKEKIECPKIIIHSNHPNADMMCAYLRDNLPDALVEMKEYNIIEVMKDL